MSKYTLSDLVVLRLLETRGEWVPSYQLIKVNTTHGWIGSSGDRRAREIAEDGYHEMNGVKYYIERRNEGKYAEYRCIGGKKTEQVVTFEDRGGVRTAVIKELVTSI